jgi:hypothetical protein
MNSAGFPRHWLIRNQDPATEDATDPRAYEGALAAQG